MPEKNLPIEDRVRRLPEVFRNQMIDRKQRFWEDLKTRLADPKIPKLDRLQEAIESGKIKP